MASAMDNSAFNPTPLPNKIEFTKSTSMNDDDSTKSQVAGSTSKTMFVAGYMEFDPKVAAKEAHNKLNRQGSKNRSWFFH